MGCGFFDGFIEIVISGGLGFIYYLIDNGFFWFNNNMFINLVLGVYMIKVWN